jgi:hypothetical protein
MEELQPHPLCEAFPKLSPSELRDLANDIRAKGLQVPIVVYDGKILDGWHRYQACLTENVEPAFQDYEGDDPISFVMSMNMHRRHMLKQDQRRVAKLIIGMHPERSDRSVAKDTGLHHTTIPAIRAEVQEEQEDAQSADSSSNGGFHHYEDEADLSDGEAIDGPGGPLDPSLAGTQRKLPPEEPKIRVESTGRKARGRKPAAKTAKEKKAERDAAKAEKKAKGKDIVNDRDAWVNATARHVTADPSHILEAFVLTVDGYYGLVQSKVSESKRRELLTRFAKALGLRFASIESDMTEPETADAAE